MSFFVVDVETDGPIPGEYSLLWIGAVRLPGLKTFDVKVKPLLGAKIKAQAMLATGLNHRDFEENGLEPTEAMSEFYSWINKQNEKGRPILWSDNNQFDGMFVDWYFHKFLGHNPFGYSSRRIGDLHCGLMRDFRARWKHLRRTKHTHNPVDDAMGNAEALLSIIEMMKEGKEGGR